MFQNKVLRNRFGPNWAEVRKYWRKLHKFYSSLNIIRVMKSRKMRGAGHMRHINAYRVLVGKPEGKRTLGRYKH